MKTIQPKDFGKDHWSLLAYIETRCVDYGGILNKAHLRIKNPVNQALSIMNSQSSWSPDYGTRLSGYFKNDGNKDKTRQLKNHDDLDCQTDLEDAGYIENMGTGLNPACKMTKLGSQVASLLRQHKTDGKHYASFKV